MLKKLTVLFLSTFLFFAATLVPISPQLEAEVDAFFNQFTPEEHKFIMYDLANGFHYIFNYRIYMLTHNSQDYNKAKFYGDIMNENNSERERIIHHYGEEAIKVKSLSPEIILEVAVKYGFPPEEVTQVQQEWEFYRSLAFQYIHYNWEAFFPLIQEEVHD